MAHQTELEISPREVMGKATKRLRRQGIIPANIFGHHQESQAVQLDAVAFEHLLRSHAATSIINLKMSGGAQTALIRHVQHEPRSGKIVHVDFFRVNVDERVHVKVPLHFVGEAPGVKNEGGVLLHLVEALDVECAAGNIPEHIDVDVSSLNQIDDIIHAGDIQLPAGVNLVVDPQEGVVKVGATKAEISEETAEAAETPAAASESTTENTSEA